MRGTINATPFCMDVDSIIRAAREALKGTGTRVGSRLTTTAPYIGVTIVVATGEGTNLDAWTRANELKIRVAKALAIKGTRDMVFPHGQKAEETMAGDGVRVGLWVPIDVVEFERRTGTVYRGAAL